MQKQSPGLFNSSPRKKPISLKRIHTIFDEQQHILGEKKHQPGQCRIQSSLYCAANVVNFFGDVHTEVFSVKVDHNDEVVAVGCSNGEVKLYDMTKGDLFSIGNTSRKSGFPCTSVRWKHKKSDDYVACNCDGTIKWFTRQQQTAYGHSQAQSDKTQYLCCDYQSLDEYAIFGSNNNTVEVYDSSTLKLKQVYEAGGHDSLEIDRHVNRVFCVKCLPDDPNVFFSGGWDSTVQIWDVRVGSGSVRQIYGPAITSDSLDYKKGTLLVGNYSNNNTAQLYSFSQGTLISNIDLDLPPNSTSYCFSASFAQRSEHNLLAVALSGSNEVKVVRDNRVVCSLGFQAAPLTVDFWRWNDRDMLIVGGLEGTVYCFRLAFNS